MTSWCLNKLINEVMMPQQAHQWSHNDKTSSSMSSWWHNKSPWRHHEWFHLDQKAFFLFLKNYLIMTKTSSAIKSSWHHKYSMTTSWVNDVTLILMPSLPIIHYTDLIDWLVAHIFSNIEMDKLLIISNI